MALTTIDCPSCGAPVPIYRGQIGAHKTQILGAYGYVDGYQRCLGSGKRMTLDEQREAAKENSNE